MVAEFGSEAQGAQSSPFFPDEQYRVAICCEVTDSHVLQLCTTLYMMFGCPSNTGLPGRLPQAAFRAEVKDLGDLKQGSFLLTPAAVAACRGLACSGFEMRAEIYENEIRKCQRNPTDMFSSADSAMEVVVWKPALHWQP
jgi:hypothetical protein